MSRPYRAGDHVVVETFNGGHRLPPSNQKRHAKTAVVVHWFGVVVGPSVMGDGWFLVRPFNTSARGTGRPYTVPESEMHRPPKRKTKP